MKKIKLARQRISIIDEWEGGRSWYIIGGEILALNDLLGCSKKFQKKLLMKNCPCCSSQTFRVSAGKMTAWLKPRRRPYLIGLPRKIRILKTIILPLFWLVKKFGDGFQKELYSEFASQLKNKISHNFWTQVLHDPVQAELSRWDHLQYVTSIL